VKAAEAKKRQAQIAHKQAEKAVRDCVLVAPSAGVVLRVNVSVGETAAPGGLQPAVMFRPDGPLVVRAELEQEFLGRVRPEMRATVRDDARAEAPAWTGRVLRVGSVVARKRSVLLEPGEVNDVRTVECVIALDGPTDGLLVGQRMRVRIGKE
jgi:multidrug resistance efflux pump